MSYVAYSFSLEYQLSQIREAAPLAYYTRECPKLRDWPDEELARIRVVLRKVIALRVANHQDAEDLVQETLLTMTLKCPEINLRKSLLIWGLGILRRKVGNYYRKTQRCTPLEEQELGGQLRLLAFTSLTPESRLHHMELSSLIDAILASFPQSERDALELYLSGLPTKEIVAHLRPERYQNIVNRLHRGRKKLAKQLERYGYQKPLKL